MSDTGSSSLRTAVGDSMAVVPYVPPPSGSPISYAPPGGVPLTRTVDGVNPFWSEKVRDDVALRALRPGGLPSSESGGAGMRALMDAVRGSSGSGMTGSAMGADRQQGGEGSSLAEENARLRMELDALKAEVSQKGSPPRMDHGVLPELTGLTFSPGENRNGGMLGRFDPERSDPLLALGAPSCGEQRAPDVLGVPTGRGSNFAFTGVPQVLGILAMEAGGTMYGGRDSVRPGFKWSYWFWWHGQWGHYG